jgi:adenylate cyclase
MKLLLRLRIFSGLILTLYMVPHLLNHSLGIFSLEAMEAVRVPFGAFIKSPPITFLLYAALLTHFALALHALWQRTTLRMKPWEGVQLAFGILIVPVIGTHVLGTRLNQLLNGDELGYGYLLAIFEHDTAILVSHLWLLCFAWVHACMGLHYWLRMKEWYERSLPVFHAAAAVIPIIALLGIFRAMAALGSGTAYLTEHHAWFLDPQSAGQERLATWGEPILIVVLLTVVLVFIAREVRRQFRKRVGAYRISLADGRVITATIGGTVLEALRDAGVPHAAVCGGRGRCTTCRVRIDVGLEALVGPTPVEGEALGRISAEPWMRLACQVRPSADLQLTPLLSSAVSAKESNRRGGVSGREQKVTSMFVDLRDSTKLGEDRLPYDVVFILNQFFAEMSTALEVTSGHYAQFSGDGLLALYGLEGDARTGCQNALRGAAEMERRLTILNRRMQAEIGYELRIGIGIHVGDAIVGTMGPPDSPNLSAIGDNVNIAARLEDMCKKYDSTVVLSSETAALAELDTAGLDKHAVEVRGRHELVDVFVLPKAEPLGAV